MKLYRQHCELQIGRYVIPVCHKVEIREKYDQLTQTCSIWLPRDASGNLYTYQNKPVALTIRRGDPVLVKLGYNGELYTEFRGYVREVKQGAPLQLECEDEMWKLKGNPITRSWRQVRLLELLNAIAPGYQYTVPDNIDLGKFTVENASAAKVLQELQKEYGLFARFLHSDAEAKPKLHVGFAYDSEYRRVEYNFQGNIKPNSRLEFRTEEEVKLKIKAIANQLDGKKITVELGDDEGEQRTLNFGPVGKAELERLAKAEMKRFRFAGYRGSISSFGWPRARTGDVADLQDTRYQEPGRNGRYLVEGFSLSFSESGYERTLDLGPKV